MAEEHEHKREEVKEVHHEHVHKLEHSGNSKKNFWMTVNVILSIIVIVLLIIVILPYTNYSANKVGKKFVSYISANAGTQLEFVKAKTYGKNLYEVTVSYNGKELPVYISKDGKIYSLQLANLLDKPKKTDNTNNKEAPKSDKPKVEAFVFAYCPYGLQFEKALFPVYDLLKNSADIKIVYIGAMHGDFEKVESLRQISIEQLYGRDKLFAYLNMFDTSSEIGACSGDATCLNKYLPAIYTALGMDKSKIESYMNKSAQAIYDADGSRASGLGVSGSPTFVINGVQVDVSRDSEDIKSAICSAFNTVPSVCGQNLSATQTSPGFGSGSGSGSSASCGS